MNKVVFNLPSLSFYDIYSVNLKCWQQYTVKCDFYELSQTLSLICGTSITRCCLKLSFAFYLLLALNGSIVNHGRLKTAIRMNHIIIHVIGITMTQVNLKFLNFIRKCYECTKDWLCSCSFLKKNRQQQQPLSHCIRHCTLSINHLHQCHHPYHLAKMTFKDQVWKK